MGQLNLQQSCPCIDQNLEEQIEITHQNIEDLENKISKIPQPTEQKDYTKEFKNINSKIQDLASKNAELSSQNVYVTDTLDNMDVEIAEIKTIADKAIVSIKKFKESGLINHSDLQSMLLDLEKKIGKGLTTSLGEVQDQLKTINQEDIEDLRQNLSTLSNKVISLSSELQEGITEEKVKFLVSEVADKVPKEDTGTKEELNFLQETVEQIQENLESFSQTLRNLPSKSGILKEVDERILKLKEEQSKIDAEQNQKIEREEIDKLTIKVTKIQEELDGNNILEIQVKAMKENLESLHEKIDAQSNNEFSEEIKKFDEKITSISSNLGNQLEEFKILFNELEEKVEDLENFKNNQDSRQSTTITQIQTKISELEVMVQNASTSSEIENMAAKLNEIEEKAEDNMKQQIEEIIVVKKKIDEIPQQQPAEQVESPDYTVEFNQYKEEINQKLKDLQSEVKLEHDKAFGKIGEIKAEVERADEMIKSTIDNLKESNGIEISSLFDKVMGIKNELIEDSRKLKEKFDRIDNEESEKQEFVLDEIKRLDSKISDQNLLVNKAIEGISNQSTASDTVPKIESSEINSKIENLKLQQEKELNLFKEEINKDKDFERDRILNCVQELNEIKKLVDQKIEDYDKGLVEKFSKFSENSDELRNMIVDFEFQIRAVDQGIIDNSQKIEDTQKKIHEVEQKYGRVARQANTISTRIEEIEKSSPKVFQTNSIEEQLNMKNNSDSIENEEIKEDSSKFDITDLFKSFNSNY